MRDKKANYGVCKANFVIAQKETKNVSHMSIKSGHSVLITKETKGTVLWGPSYTSQVSWTVLMLGCRVSLLAPRDSGHGACVPAKDTPMPKSVLVMLVVSENI